MLDGICLGKDREPVHRLSSWQDVFCFFVLFLFLFFVALPSAFVVIVTVIVIVI